MSDELRPASGFRLLARYGLNENPDPDVGECSSGYNFDIAIDRAQFTPRKPFDLKGTATNASTVTGIMQLVTRAGVQTTLVAAGTALYLWDGASTWTSKATIPSGSLLRDLFWPLGDYSLITDVSLQNVLLKWDGTSITNATTGLGGTSLSAKYGVVHQGRVWLFNVTSNVTTPHLMVASTFEDPTNFNLTNRGGPTVLGGAAFTTGTEPFYMTTPDLRPINGVVEFQNTLIISTTNGRMFQLVGSSAKDYTWIDFIDGSPSVGNESVANVGNDVVFMRTGGHVNLLSATQTFGDARAYELTRWLKQTIANLSGTNQIIYDISNQKILFFIASKVMVLFKDFIASIGKSPWSVYTTQHPNAFNALAAKYMQIPTTTNYSVYFGDANGNVFDLNGSGSSGDAGTYPIIYNRRSRHIGPELLQAWPWNERNLEGSVEYRRVGMNQLNLTFDWDDEYNSSVSTINLKGPAAADSAWYFNDTHYFNNTNIFFNDGTGAEARISDYDFSPSGKGPGFYLSVDSTTNTAFQVDSIQLR